MALIHTKSHTTRSPDKWRRWVEPWYLAYALQGAVIAGLIPILLPLAVSHNGNAADIGLVMASFSLGGLSAPFWGSLADHYRLHRYLLVLGLLALSGGLIGFSLSTLSVIRIGLALFQGFGAASAATVGNLLIVEAHPKSEWDERIGWLQTFYGIGQVVGLMLAGLLTQSDLHIGLITAAGISGAAALLGWVTTKTPSIPLDRKPVLPHPAQHGEWVTSSPQRMFHYMNLPDFRNFLSSLRSPFMLFLMIWLPSMAGSLAFFSQYPVLMQKVFSIPPAISSSAFAVAAGVGLGLYSPAGSWSEKYGPVRVIRGALGIRWLAYVGLFALGFTHLGFQNGLALLAFAFVVCAWSLISVSGTTLAAQLSPVGEGEGLGIFNATSALAGVIGAALAGWVAKSWGYHFIAVLAVAGIAFGLILSSFLHTSHGKG